MTFSTFDAVVFTVAFVVPGFVCSTVLSLLVPRRDPNAKQWTLEFLTLSCFNNALWSWLIVLLVNAEMWRSHPGWLAVCVFLVLFVSPTGLALVIGKLHQRDAISRVLSWLGFDTVSRIPTAWNYHFGRERPSWIIVTLKSGSRIYGFFGLQSFAGNDPNARDLYIEAVCRPTDQNEWTLDRDTGGVWIAPDQVVAVEFRNIGEISNGEEADHH